MVGAEGYGREGVERERDEGADRGRKVELVRKERRQGEESGENKGSGESEEWRGSRDGVDRSEKG